MPYYLYEARDAKGRLIKSQAFAVSTQELIKTLQRDGHIILSIKESALAADQGHKRLHRKAKLSDLLMFAKELAVLLENGIPIIEAIDVMIKQMSSAGLISACKLIKKDLENGSNLKDAMSKHPKIFSDTWTHLVEAGEVSGQLPFVIRQVTSFLEESQKIKSRVLNALVYPSVLVLIAVIAVLVFLLKIIPTFKDMYATFNTKLPAITEFVLSISKFTQDYFFAILAIAIVAAVFFSVALKTRQGRRRAEIILLKLPVFGTLFMSMAIQKFSDTLRVLLKSGIPIIKSMEMAAAASESVLFEEKIEGAKIKVVAGLPLADSLQQCGLFPPIVIQLVLVAEKTGNYAGMFDEISKYYGAIIENYVARVTALIEPAILVMMALVIGILVTAMFMPIFKIAGIGV